MTHPFELEVTVSSFGIHCSTGFLRQGEIKVPAAKRVDPSLNRSRLQKGRGLIKLCEKLAIQPPGPVGGVNRV